MEKYRNKTLFILFIILVFIWGLHVLGTYFFWYWRMSWFDIIVHGLAGVWVGGISLWFYYLSGYIKPQYYGGDFIILLSLVVVLFVGVAWEIFEVLIGSISVLYQEYSLDTAIDIIIDIVGALIASFYFYIIKNKVTV